VEDDAMMWRSTREGGTGKRVRLEALWITWAEDEADSTSFSTVGLVGRAAAHSVAGCDWCRRASEYEETAAPDVEWAGNVPLMTACSGVSTSRILMEGLIRRGAQRRIQLFVCTNCGGSFSGTTVMLPEGTDKDSEAENRSIERQGRRNNVEGWKVMSRKD